MNCNFKKLWMTTPVPGTPASKIKIKERMSHLPLILKNVSFTGIKAEIDVLLTEVAVL